MHNKLLLTLSSLVILAASTAQAQTTIEQLAPENTAIIIGANNVQTTIDRFKKTGMWTLWQSDEVKELRGDAMEKFANELDELLEELGVDEDSLVPPTGSAGLVVFVVTDEELGTKKPACLVYADYGDNADKTANLIQAALDRGEEEGEIEFDEKDVHGHTALAIKLNKAESEDDEFDFDDFDMNPMPIPSPDEIIEGLEEIFYLRNENSLFFSTDLGALTESLDTLKGHGSPSLADRKEYQAMAKHLGDVDAYVMVMTRNLGELISAGDDMGMMMMMTPTLKALVGDIQGMGMGLRFDGQKAMFEEPFVVYMPNGKQGLTKLLDSPSRKNSLPSFVGTDAISYSSFTFKFSGLMETIRQVVMSNPMLAGEGQQWLATIEPTVNEITASLGSVHHSTSSTSQPITAQSGSGAFVVQCTDEQRFENFLAPFAAQWGLESRDFQGQRIFTMDLSEMFGAMGPGMMAGFPMDSLSIGIGGGNIYLGPTPSVENCLRSTGRPGEGGLANTEKYERSVSLLDDHQDVVAWGFSNIIDTMEMTVASQKASMEKMIEDMREWAPEYADEQEAEFKEMFGFWDSIDFELLRRYLGPTAWQVRSTSDGFVGEVYLISAGEN